MLFQARQIKGIGRGHKIGFPTINLLIPEGFHIDEGIYAVWVVIDNLTYKGALHYGPIPTFDLKDKTLEVHLIDVTDGDAPETFGKEIEIDVVERIRDIRYFDTALELATAISEDVQKVKLILK
ncbi:MAG: riboflavin kinase [Patescibacteria group bacterium]